MVVLISNISFQVQILNVEFTGNKHESKILE